MQEGKYAENKGTAPQQQLQGLVAALVNQLKPPQVAAHVPKKAIVFDVVGTLKTLGLEDLEVHVLLYTN